LVDQFARSSRRQHFLPEFWSTIPFWPGAAAISQGRLKLWAGGDRITGVVHVDDLVAAMILAAEGKPGEHYIISAGDLTTREMFKILERNGHSSSRELQTSG